MKPGEVKCNACDGVGKVRRPSHAPGPASVLHDCNVCRGRGHVIDIDSLQVELVKARQRILELESNSGLHIKCGNCGKPITKPGALLVYIGPPDKDGNFTGHKEHVCLECDDENNARGLAEHGILPVYWTHVAMIEGKKVRVRKLPDGVWEAEGYEGQRVTMSGTIRPI